MRKAEKAFQGSCRLLETECRDCGEIIGLAQLPPG
jgi:hypothetical protein